MALEVIRRPTGHYAVVDTATQTAEQGAEIVGIYTTEQEARESLQQEEAN